MAELTTEQQAALARYERLQSARPELFVGRESRPIVTEREPIEEFMRSTGQIIGVLVESPFMLLVNDLVQSRTPNGPVSHGYLRVCQSSFASGGIHVVVVATLDNPALGSVGDIVMVRQERHSTGLSHLELPRGFGAPGLPGEENALKELQQETGYIGARPRLLAATHTDTGMSDTLVHYYHVEVVDQKQASPEIAEVIQDVRVMSRDEIWRQVADGHVSDGYTVQGLGLLHDLPGSRART